MKKCNHFLNQWHHTSSISPWIYVHCIYSVGCIYIKKILLCIWVIMSQSMSRLISTFSLQNERIAKTIFYDINWLKLDKKNRRLICMFHFSVQQSLDLFAFSIFKASFFTFTGIIRMTYSYFNILRASLRNSWVISSVFFQYLWISWRIIHIFLLQNSDSVLNTV